MLASFPAYSMESAAIAQAASSQNAAFLSEPDCNALPKPISSSEPIRQGQ